MKNDCMFRGVEEMKLLRFCECVLFRGVSVRMI